MSQKLNKFQTYLDLYEKLVKVNAGNFVDEQLSEDVAQETFLKMYEHLDYLNDEMVKQWLIVVSGNIAKDYLKKGGSIEMHPMEPAKLVENMECVAESAEESYEQSVKQQAARKLLWSACNLLYEKNPIWYYIMIDSCMLGMSSRQIAEALDLSVGNIDVMKQRARKYLHKYLGEDFHEFF